MSTLLPVSIDCQMGGGEAQVTNATDEVLVVERGWPDRVEPGQTAVVPVPPDGCASAVVLATPTGSRATRLDLCDGAGAVVTARDLVDTGGVMVVVNRTDRSLLLPSVDGLDQIVLDPGTSAKLPLVVPLGACRAEPDALPLRLADGTSRGADTGVAYRGPACDGSAWIVTGPTLEGWRGASATVVNHMGTPVWLGVGKEEVGPLADGARRDVRLSEVNASECGDLELVLATEQASENGSDPVITTVSVCDGDVWTLGADGVGEVDRALPHPEKPPLPGSVDVGAGRSPRAASGQGVGELVQRPVEVLAADHQRR
jgi:hypothetical protein